MARIECPGLANFTGITNDGIVSFRGVQYATLEDRFAEPVLKAEYHDIEQSTISYG